MYTTIIALLAVALGFVLGVIYCARIVKSRLDLIELTDEQWEKLQPTSTKETAAQKEIDVLIEEADGNLFAYRHSDKKFLAQSDTYDELVAKLKTRLGPCIVKLYADDTELHDRLLAQITKQS